MNTYRWNAQDYAQNSQAQQQWAKELIAQLQLCGHENVLDLGCGDGKVTAEIARIVDHGTVVGIDNSEAMIALAKRRYPEQQHPNLSFRVMDTGNLSFTECFDVVFSNAALHWVKRHQPVIDGLYRSLKSNGATVPPMKKITAAASCDFLIRRGYVHNLEMASAY